MAMGMMTEYYHFIFTTLVMYLRVLAWIRVGLPQNKVSLGGGWGGQLLQEIQTGLAS